MIYFALCECKYAAMMNWDDLKYLLATAQFGTYSEAARALKVNRTTVARRITALEAQLGLPLFEQGQESYKLTETGQQVVTSARYLEQEIDKLQTQARCEEQLLKGSLRIAAPLGLGPEFMPELASFSKQYPHVKLELINALDPMHCVNLRRADIGIGVSHQLPDYLKGSKVGDLTRAAYAAKSYLKHKSVKLDLSEHDWVGWGDEMAHTEVARWMQSQLSAQTPITARVNSWHALREAVVHGLGVAQLWCFLANCEKSLVQVRKPTSELAIGLWLFNHTEVPTSAKMQVFYQHMSEQLKQRIQL
jgi:DNA-binding transcriptional LysR family regulator